jgi:hypothetical protein
VAAVRTYKVAFAVVLAAAALAACQPRPLLRDWYVGREVLEPDKYVERVERDTWGNPILPPKAP